MLKLDKFVAKDARIKKVYNYAKKKEKEANLLQHNWEHIIRDLYRALIIAEDEEEKGERVNYSILIPAVLLHDIGATEGEYSKHTEKGPKVIRRDLGEFGFSESEIEKISHCVRVHKNNENQNSEEAKILFDADHLEKSGACSLFASYQARLEVGASIEEWISKRSEGDKSNEDLFTDKAKEISGEGFKERKEHFKKAKESLKEREDWTVREEDLWKSK